MTVPRKTTKLDAAPRPDTISRPKPPTQYDLAAEWAETRKDEYLFAEGAQWWRYEDGLWSYSSVERVQASVQEFLTRRHSVDPLVSITPGNVKSVLFLAQHILGPHPLSDFDSRPYLIALKNGVYDTQEGGLMPHSPAHRLTHQAAYEYDEEARCPRWTRFLGEVMLTADALPNPEWIGILQEWFGYCLIADASAQAAMFWVGEGQNGKGTATRVLEGLVGTEYSTAIPIEQLHDPYYRASLHGKLLGLVNEPDPKALQKNGNYFKALTGGDRIDARRPTEKVFSFTPTCRLVISCNDLPSTRDVSRGYFRRILLIEWRYNVPDEQRDSGLDDALAAELPGIFNWAMKGLCRWSLRGRKFDVPDESRLLLSEYRKSEDTLARFLEDETRKEEGCFVANSAFYTAYARWCKDQGERADTAESCGRRLKKQGYVSKVKFLNGRTVRGWEGVILSDTREEDG